ncbi:MAG: hypothetical protein QM664_09480 [Flavihumibacter sp.]
MLLSVAALLGRFHPIIVHFPVGILVLGVGFSWLAKSNKYAQLKPAITLILFWGMVSAVFSCVSGWLLAADGNYEGELVDQHRWMGITTALSSFVLWLMNRRQTAWQRPVSLAVLALVTITGHLGGSLTHGEDYLQEALGSGSAKGPVVQQLENPDTAVLYNSLVQPILEARCYSCHGENKQKGKLRLDALSYMLKGGEEGVALAPGKPEESGLISRIELPADAKDHMPPKEKTPLTADEIKILHWWVAGGGSDTARIGNLAKTAEIRNIMQRLAQGTTGADANSASALPSPEPPVADTAALNALQRAGVTAIPPERGSHWLTLSFVGAFDKNDTTLALLVPVAKQVLFLRLDHYQLTEKGLSFILACTSLRRLELPHCGVDDAMLQKLAKLNNLRMLNLTGNPVSAAGVQRLIPLKELQQLYLYQTKLTGPEMGRLQQQWSSVKIDTGGYRLPMLPGDTSELKIN